MTVQLQSPTDVDFLGCRVRFLATGDDTGGAFGLVDMRYVPPGHMPPLHVHHNEDEGFYLLEGRVSIFTPEGRTDLEPGDFVLAKRGVPHAYRVGEEPARWLVTSTPAGFESFVADVAALEEADPETLTAVGAAHGIEILGPPGTLP